MREWTKEDLELFKKKQEEITNHFIAEMTDSIKYYNKRMFWAQEQIERSSLKQNNNKEVLKGFR